MKLTMLAVLCCLFVTIGSVDCQAQQSNKYWRDRQYNDRKDKEAYRHQMELAELEAATRRYEADQRRRTKRKNVIVVPSYWEQRRMDQRDGLLPPRKAYKKPKPVVRKPVRRRVSRAK